MSEGEKQQKKIELLREIFRELKKLGADERRSQTHATVNR